MNHYSKILKEYGISPLERNTVDAISHDGRIVMTFVITAFWNNLFDNRAIEEYILEGSMKRWLERLYEIDKYMEKEEKSGTG